MTGMKHLVSMGLLAALGLGLIINPAAAADATPTPAPSAAAVVHIKDFAFVPARLKVHAGERVMFVNDDDEAHTVTATDKRFDSGGLDTNDSWTHAFVHAGTFQYFCALHPYMKGAIVVLPPATPAHQ